MAADRSAASPARTKQKARNVARLLLTQARDQDGDPESKRDRATKRSEPPAHGVSAWCAAPTLNRVSQVRLLSVRSGSRSDEPPLTEKSGFAPAQEASMPHPCHTRTRF